jgi:hypothetical protein
MPPPWWALAGITCALTVSHAQALHTDSIHDEDNMISLQDSEDKHPEIPSLPMSQIKQGTAKNMAASKEVLLQLKQLETATTRQQTLLPSLGDSTLNPIGLGAGEKAVQVQPRTLQSLAAHAGHLLHAVHAVDSADAAHAVVHCTLQDEEERTEAKILHMEGALMARAKADSAYDAELGRLSSGSDSAGEAERNSGGGGGDGGNGGKVGSAETDFGNAIRAALRKMQVRAAADAAALRSARLDQANQKGKRGTGAESKGRSNAVAVLERVAADEEVQQCGSHPLAPLPV